MWSDMQPTETCCACTGSVGSGDLPLSKYKPFSMKVLRHFVYTESTHAATCTCITNEMCADKDACWHTSSIYVNSVLVHAWIHTFALAQRHIQIACLTSVQIHSNTAYKPPMTIPSRLCGDRKLKSACRSITLILIIHHATRKTDHSNLFLHGWTIN